MSETCTIGGLARQTGVHVETIRYYQRRGLVDEPARPPGGIRRYGEGHIRRLRFIRRAQAIGFSLDEIRELLRLDDGAQCDEAQALAEKRLADVRGKVAELQRIEAALADLVDRCDAADGRVNCPLIESLQDAG